MTDDPIARLAGTVGVARSELAMLEGFSTADVSMLADAVERAFLVQRAEVDQSLDSALGFIPRPLRGRARRLLFPGGGRG